MKELYSAGSRAHNRGTVGAQIFEIRSGQDLSSSLETGEVSRYLLDHSRDLILALDKRGKVLFANRHALNVVGYSPEEFIGKPILRFLPSGSARKVLLMLALEFLGRPQAESEFQVKTKSGETRYIRLAEGSAFIRDGGRVAGILVTGTDITGQRKAEIDAQASESRFRDLWENAPVAYQIADLKGTVTDANQTEARLLGYRRAELVGKSMFDLIAPRQRAIVEENFRLKIAGKPAPKSRQRTFIRKDGSPISLMVDDTLERDAKGKVTGIRSTLVDITKLKASEEALRKSEEHFRDLVEKSGIAIYVDDRDGHFKYFNERYAEIIGYTAEEMKELAPWSTVHPDDVEMVRACHLGRLEGRDVPSRYEFRAIRKDGSVRHLEVDVTIMEENGRPVGTRSFMWDITDRKRVEEALRENEDQFRALSEAAQDAIIMMGNDGRITFWSHAAERILGYSKEEALGQFMHVLLTPRVYQEAFEKAFPEWVRTGQGAAVGRTVELTARRKDGSEIPVEISLSSTKINGSWNAIGIVRDITDRKRAEEDRRESAERFRSVVEHSHDGIVLVDDAFRVIYANAEAVRAFGYPDEKIVGQNFRNFLDDESRELVTDMYRRRQKGETVPSRYEFNIVRGSGEKRRIEISSSVVANAAGRMETIAQLRDITERQRLEKDLRRIEWMLSPGHGNQASSDGAPEGTVALSSSNLASLNTSRLILGTVGHEMLRNIVSDHLDLLETCSIVFETNGDYAFGVASSAWCRFMRRASRRLCGTEDDRQALAGGKWRCHESCWTGSAKVAIRTGKPVDVACAGGIHCFAVPIRAGTEIIGAVKIGYGDPPQDRARLEKLAAAYGVAVEELAEQAAAYESRPPYIVEMAKRRLEISARIIAEIFEHARADARLEKTLADLRKIIGATVQAIATAVEARDPYTAGHQKRVSDLARVIATEMGLSHDEIEGVRTAGLIHDLGKLSVPAEILSKPTKLSDVEYALIKTHSQSGYDILKDISFPWPVARMVLEHHERMDGSGYPQGLKGEEILVESRILAVADVVEAIASHRPYRPSKGIQAALDEIAARKGRLYDAAVVDACLAVLAKGYQFPQARQEGPAR